MTHGPRARRLAAGLALLGFAAGCQGTGKHVEPTQPIRPLNKDAAPATGTSGAKSAAAPAARTPAAGQPGPVVTNAAFPRPAADTPPQPLATTGAVGVPALPTTGGTLTPTPRSAPSATVQTPTPPSEPTAGIRPPEAIPIIKSEPTTPTGGSASVLPPMPPSSPGGGTTGVPTPPAAIAPPVSIVPPSVLPK